MKRRDIEVKRCCSCMFGKRVRMDSNYEYPIQYICSLTSLRVYTRCYDYPSPEWCPYKQSKSLIELIRSGKLRPPQKINTCEFCLGHYKDEQ